jgi:glycosyltransferase involved in cell wall biosynthesis
MNQMSKMRLDQFVIGASPGDAITDHALLLQKWLREDGFHSDVFAESVHPDLTDVVQSYYSYRPSKKNEIVVLHHSIGSDIVDYLLSLEVQIVMVYHNITQPEFVQDVDPRLARQLIRGRQQLRDLQSRTILGLGDSVYDENELKKAGYDRTGVLPIALNESFYDIYPNLELLRRYDDEYVNLLFVGRLVPNKRQEDLIKLLYHLHRIKPNVRLFIVGSAWLPSYAEWLRGLANELNVSDLVIFTGFVTQQDLVTYYRLADLYVSMSEHEGFGKPFIESMYFDVPIMAYAATAVPETLGEAGILFRHKHFEVLAEMVYIVLTNTDLQQRIIAYQRRRIVRFLPSYVSEIWQKIIRDLATYHFDP